MEMTQKSSGFEKQSLGLKAEVADLSQKLSLLKDKVCAIENSSRRIVMCII